MKKSYLVGGIIAVVILGVLGYTYKHQIKLLLMGGGSSTTSLYNYSASSPNPTSAQTGAVASFQSSAKGNYLVAANGMTLYTFDKDAANVSNCTGTCASNWPAYVTASVPSSLPTGIGTFTRTDGKIQFTFNKMPLYYYAGDNAAGDMNGDGFGGIWHIVKQ